MRVHNHTHNPCGSSLERQQCHALLLHAVLVLTLQEEVAEGEHIYALVGLCVCVAAFVAYLWYQYHLSQSGGDTTHQMVVDAVIIRKIAAREISLLGALQVCGLSCYRYDPLRGTRFIDNGRDC